MMKKLLCLTAVAIVTIGVAAYAIGYEKFKINDASDYVSEYVLEFDANTNKPTNLDSTDKNGAYKAYTKDHNEITIKYENASANPNGYINLGQGGSIFNPYIEGGYGNNRISSILNLTANFTGELTLSLSAVNSTTYSIKNQSLTSGELYSVTNDDQYSYFRLDASTNCSITSIEIKYSCVYVDTAAFEFVKVDNGYELTHYNGDGGDVVIPDTYLGLPVISIGNSAFENCESLISVTIPSSVTSIGSYAFYNCDSLTSITIPDSVTTIGNHAFSGCNNLTTVTFGENSQLTTIGNHAFYNCDSLTSITIPDSVTSISYNAFAFCSNLTIYCEAASKPSGWSSSWNPSNRPVIWDCLNAKTTEDGLVYYIHENEDGTKYIVIGAYIGTATDVVIPDTISVDGVDIPVTTIGERAFYGNDTITSVTIGNNVTSIGDRAFYDCDSLTSITIPDSVTTIGNHAFSGCNNLTTVTIGENSQLTTIGSRAFEDCSSLTSIIIPDSVTTIGSSAFSGCDSLISITIPDSVTTIGSYAFFPSSYPSNLTIYCEAASKPSGWSSSWNPSYRPVVWDCLNAKTTEDGLVYYIHENEDGTKYIVIGAYIGTATDVVIPDTISVDGVDIPVTTIAENAFCNNDTITSVTIGNNVTSIGDRAFYDCDSLTSITIPDSVTTIGNYAFSICNNLTTITFGENSQLTSIDDYAFYDCDSLTSIIIPDSVTTIGEYAFYWCSNLTTVTFGENSQLTTIGNYAFYDCDSLTSITIPDSVTTIGSYAFYNCSSLTSIIFGENSQLTSIGSSAFEYCSSLISITIPDSVTTIGRYAFRNCSNLTIYCEAASQPSGWSPYWNYSNRPVEWGYTGE